MRCVTVRSPANAHAKQDGRKAAGVDRVTKGEYEENLADNLAGLVERMRAFSYRPQPAGRARIPKANGKTRPLGIPAYEDRPGRSVMADILVGACEPRFLDCFYGFRPGRSCHQVAGAVDSTVTAQRADYVPGADIRGFFDNVDHEWKLL